MRSRSLKHFVLVILILSVFQINNFRKIDHSLGLEFNSEKILFETRGESNLYLHFIVLTFLLNGIIHDGLGLLFIGFGILSWLLKKALKLCVYRWACFLISTKSSGENIKQDRLTYRGHKQLRTIMVEAAWIAINTDSAIAKKYGNLKKG